MKRIALISTAVIVATSTFASANADTVLLPVRLHSGMNTIPNIAGDGRPGTISLQWRDNGNAWGYDIYTVSAGGSVVTLDGDDQITDRPHTGDDMLRSVRFARCNINGRSTLIVLTATRVPAVGAPDPARTEVRTYALQRNDSGLGTPYAFQPLRRFWTHRSYCNADMALRSELGFPLARSYSGPMTVDGCQH